MFCYFEWIFVFLECGFRCYFLGGSFLGVWFRVTGSGPPCFKPLCPGPPSHGPANPGPPFSRTPSAAPASLNRPLSGQGFPRTHLHRTFQERSWSPPFLDRHAFLWFVWLLPWTASPEPISPRTALRWTLLPLDRPLPSPPYTGHPFLPLSQTPSSPLPDLHPQTPGPPSQDHPLQDHPVCQLWLCHLLQRKGTHGSSCDLISRVPVAAQRTRVIVV